jgi:hypothetical protein
VRIPVEFLFMCFTGIDLVLTAAAVVAFVLGFAHIPDSTFRGLAQSAQMVAPFLLAAVALRASYLTGTVEGRRNIPPPIAYTREHIDKMNEVSAEVRQRVQWSATTDYNSETAPAGTEDLVRALDSHFADLHLARWDAAATELQAARTEIENHVKAALQGQRGPGFYENVELASEVAQQGVAPQLVWTILETQGVRQLHLKTWNVGYVCAVSNLDEKEISAVKDEWQKDTADTAAWPQGKHFRAIREGMEQQRAALLDRLREISQVDALPAGTRCHLCDPRA